MIRLWPDEAVTYGLGVAEGIETALSPAWVAEIDELTARIEALERTNHEKGSNG